MMKQSESFCIQSMGKFSWGLTYFDEFIYLCVCLTRAHKYLWMFCCSEAEVQILHQRSGRFGCRQITSTQLSDQVFCIYLMEFVYTNAEIIHLCMLAHIVFVLFSAQCALF